MQLTVNTTDTVCDIGLLYGVFFKSMYMNVWIDVNFTLCVISVWTHFVSISLFLCLGCFVCDKYVWEGMLLLHHRRRCCW